MEKELIGKFQQMLIEEKKSLQEDLSRIANPVGKSDEYETRYNEIGPDRDENASEVEEYSDNVALEDNLEKQLKEVDAALERIENGTYGVCEVGGEEISQERLVAYPAARTCINHGAQK